MAWPFDRRTDFTFSDTLAYEHFYFQGDTDKRFFFRTSSFVRCFSCPRNNIYTSVVHSALFKTLKPLIALRSAHTVLPVCFVKQLKCLCNIFTTFAGWSTEQLCFSLQYGHHSKPAAPNLQHTTNWEQDNRCGNSTTVSSSWWWIY